MHLPLKLGAKSKQTRDVYWVLPIKSLDIGTSRREHIVAEFTLNGNKSGEANGKERTDVVHVHLEFVNAKGPAPLTTVKPEIPIWNHERRSLHPRFRRQRRLYGHSLLALK